MFLCKAAESGMIDNVEYMRQIMHMLRAYMAKQQQPTTTPMIG